MDCLINVYSLLCRWEGQSITSRYSITDKKTFVELRICMGNCVADTGYSSGENYAF